MTDWISQCSSRHIGLVIRLSWDTLQDRDSSFADPNKKVSVKLEIECKHRHLRIKSLVSLNDGLICETTMLIYLFGDGSDCHSD